ncbi:MAG: basic amino acid/polyamine antiporter, family [Chloroflexota bacterium]|jgi:amino acid transporter|nr:basic amino acid/polyamine antiporter, family [Chloroflexota bacterium]
MSTAVSVGKGGTTGVFLRKATGLVREVSLIDALIMNTLGMNVAVGAVFLFLQAPANFPDGNMLVAVIVGTLLMAFTLLWVYSEFAAAMPRSGGDYVFVSRALHPFVGWLLSWSQGLWLIFFWIGFNAWFALIFAVPTALSAISVATGQDVWMNGANALISSFSFLGITTQWYVLLFGTAINVAFGALLLFGNRSYWRVQRWLFLFAGGSILIAVLLLIFRGSDIPSAWNAFAGKAGGLAFDKVIPTAQSAGYTLPKGGFNFGQTLLMLPWVFFVVGYAQGSAQIGGEVKRAARTQRIAMVGGVLINGAVLALLVILFTSALGVNWIGSLGYLANNAPAKLGLPGTLTPGFNFIVSLLTQNVVILLVIGIGFVLWALLGTPLSELQATRYMLAWALDRTVPKKLGDVSERFHTPVAGIVLATITGEIALVALVVNSQASLLGALLAQIAAFILVSIAGIVFPYRLKSVWQSAGGGRLFGVPTVTLAGIGGVIVLGAFAYEFLFNSVINATFAVTRQLSLEFMIGVPIIGIIWYAAAYFINKSRGIDLALAYKELPPE